MTCRRVKLLREHILGDCPAIEQKEAHENEYLQPVSKASRLIEKITGKSFAAI
jgi:hypothetical protein